MIESTLGEFADNLAARQPTPGGGAAAGYAASMGASLLQMVVRFCQGRSENSGREEKLTAAETALEELRAKLLSMIEKDCLAFDRVTSAYRLPETEAGQEVRQQALEEALLGAIAVPSEVICLCRDSLHAAVEVSDCLNKSVASDFAAGATLLLAAGEAASLSIISNAAFLKDEGMAVTTRGRASELLEEVSEARARVEAAVGTLLV
ncbi:MAG: cyclodeaminase/cyclohydrolase family protein [Planctomycetota bacterium]|jgi:formiminotetrahydrofolate cyclodeaminase